MSPRSIVLLPLLLSVSATSHAAPALRYTWGDASAFVRNQDFNGPATYTQTLSVVGHEGETSSIEVLIMHGRLTCHPEGAWAGLCPEPIYFEEPAPRLDCLGGPGYSVAAGVAGAAGIPGAQVTSQVMRFVGITRPDVAGGIIRVQVAIDPPFVADPATRYGIATLEFHHQNSAAGESAVACGGAGTPSCFLIQSTYIDNAVPIFEDGLLSWQFSQGYSHDACLELATRASTSTWGALKSMYR
jgi:hypothetical protein